jgi:tetrahydromethanopterin S-methyltransferase subunit H
MPNYNFNQSDGLLLVGLPDKNLPLLNMLSEKLGEDIATVIAKSLLYLAHNILTDTEKKILQQKMKEEN